jgi:hypothetical protein
MVRVVVCRPAQSFDVKLTRAGQLLRRCAGSPPSLLTRLFQPGLRAMTAPGLV